MNWRQKPLSVARWLIAAPLVLALILGLVQRGTHRHDSADGTTCDSGHGHACGAHRPLLKSDETGESGHEHGEPAERDSSCAVCHLLAQNATPGVAGVQLPAVGPVGTLAPAELPSAPSTRSVAFYLSRAPPSSLPGRSLV